VILLLYCNLVYNISVEKLSHTTDLQSNLVSSYNRDISYKQTSLAVEHILVGQCHVLGYNIK